MDVKNAFFILYQAQFFFREQNSIVTFDIISKIRKGETRNVFTIL